MKTLLYWKWVIILVFIAVLQAVYIFWLGTQPAVIIQRTPPPWSMIPSTFPDNKMEHDDAGVWAEPTPIPGIENL